MSRVALAAAPRADSENGRLFFGVQMLVLCREQGRLAELEQAVKTFIENFPAVPGWRSVLAFLHSDVGRHAEARQQFDEVMADLEHLPYDVNWLVAATLLSEVCHSLDDEAKARRLYDSLLPYAGRNIVICAGAGSVGAASRYLGLLATTMRSWQDAEHHFRDAIDMNRRMGARPWLARSQYGYAGMLAVRGQAGDEGHALFLLEDSLSTAQEIGQVSLVERALGLRRELQGEAGQDAGSSPASSI